MCSSDLSDVVCNIGVPYVSYPSTLLLLFLTLRYNQLFTLLIENTLNIYRLEYCFGYSGIEKFLIRLPEQGCRWRNPHIPCFIGCIFVLRRRDCVISSLSICLSEQCQALNSLICFTNKLDFFFVEIVAKPCAKEVASFSYCPENQRRTI